MNAVDRALTNVEHQETPAEIDEPPVEAHQLGAGTDPKDTASPPPATVTQPATAPITRDRVVAPTAPTSHTPSTASDSSRRYEVDIGSLAPALHTHEQLAPIPKAPFASALVAAVLSDNDEWERKLAWIMPALAARDEGGSALCVLDQIARQPGAPPLGTLKSWFTHYNKYGVVGLQRKRRADAGKRRAMISAKWDATTKSLPPEERCAIVEEIELHIRSLYAAGAPGRRHVANLATRKLIDLTRAAGIEMTEPEALEVCCVPERFAYRWRAYQVVAIKRNDAKTFSDHYVPRIKRDRGSLKPMDWVAGDVHHSDLLYGRDDQSTATAKLIVWEDLATDRLFVTVVFLPPGRAIRQEDVIVSFIDMVQEWGMPSALYLDNGPEYGKAWTNLIKDALKCPAFTNHAIKIVVGSGIKRARPYNAQAKVIESLFSALERGPFAMLRGHIGGNRMKPKVPHVGKAPTPFRGSTDELRRQIETAIAYYNSTPSTADHLGGRSPRQAYEDHIAAGWRMTTIERHLLEAMVAEDITRLVDRGRISVSGIEYYSDELLAFSGQTVHVRMPKVGDRSRLAVLDDAGRVLFFVQKHQVFPFGDRSGAIEQARRARAMNESVAKLRAKTKPVDLPEEMQRVVAHQPPAVVAPVGGRVTLSRSIQAQAEARRSLPPPESIVDRASERQRRQIAALTRYDTSSGVIDDK